MIPEDFLDLLHQLELRVGMKFRLIGLFHNLIPLRRDEC